MVHLESVARVIGVGVNCVHIYFAATWGFVCPFCVQAYCPLGQGTKLSDPELVKLAARVSKTPAQVNKASSCTRSCLGCLHQAEIYLQFIYQHVFIEAPACHPVMLALI